MAVSYTHLGEVINWGNELFGCGIDLYKTGQNPGDAFAALFNSKDLSGMGEVLLWRKYSSDEGVFHDVNGNLKAGVVDVYKRQLLEWRSSQISGR